MYFFLGAGTDTGLTDTGLTDTVLTDTGLTDTGLTDMGLPVGGGANPTVGEGRGMCQHKN